MEELYEILEELQPEVDFKTATNLNDGHLLSSLSIISLIAELEHTFDITIPAVEIVPANFNSAYAIWALVQRLSEDD